MTCADVLERLPDDGAVSEHLAGCPSCRAEQALYDQDGRDLAAALRSTANDSNRLNRSGPLVAAAAALFAVLLGLAMFRPAPPARISPAADPLEFLVSRENALWGQVLAFDPESGDVAGSVGLRDGVVARQALTLYRRTAEGEVEVGVLEVDRVQHAVSAGRLVERRLDPAPGDFALADRLLDAAEKAAVLDHLFSFRPVTDADRRAVLAALARLGDPDLSVREAARSELLAGGGAVRAAIDALEHSGLDLALRIRAREALEEADGVDRIVRGPGLERDVDFLTRLRDPRGAERARAILGGLVAPDADLHDAWSALRSRVRWNPELDRWEAAP